MDPSWHQLAVQARIRFLAGLGRAPSAEVDSAAGVTAVVTGVADNTLNGVYNARLDPAGADAVIAATVARFGRRQAPAIWWLDPDSAPADLPSRLEAAGLRPEETGIVRGAPIDRVLARTSEILAAGVDPGAGPAGRPGLLIREVRDPGDLDRWIEVARAAWGEDPPGELARRRDLYLGLGLGPDAPLRHWVAVEGDRTVGMASAFSTDRVALLDHLEVAEEHRRRRIGTALLRMAMTEGRRRGCRWAVLEPTPESAAFYDALGFEVEACRPGVEFYLPLEPPGPDDRP